MSKNHAQDLRRILAENKFLTLPGVYDCLSGKIAEEAGFPALFLSGGALAYSVLGRPDFWLLSLAGVWYCHIFSTSFLPVRRLCWRTRGQRIWQCHSGSQHRCHV